MSLYASAVKRPIMTTLCFVAVVILGIFSLIKLPIDLYPDIETNTIMVMTTYAGASASDSVNSVLIQHLRKTSPYSPEVINRDIIIYLYGICLVIYDT